MFYAGSAATAGSCPAGGPHENNGSSDYRVFYLDEPVLTAPPSDAASKVQVGWEWCKKCQGLFFGGGEEGACPAGDGHDSTGSQNYALYVDATVTGQKKWRWCNKCQGMWFSGTATSACPAGGGHTGAESGDYCIATDDGQAAPSNGSRQSGWRWCYKCQGMFFAGSSATAGSCPSGGPHENKGSSDYRMIYMINDGALDAVDGCADNDLSAELREAAITAAINENPDNASTSFDDESVNMVAAIRKLWKRGRTLHVRFIGGHPELHQYVRSYATIWSQHANIKFAFDNRLNAEIRVSFRRGGGCWSYIGTDALVVPYRSATMNLDWFSAKSHPSAIRRTILHEFGHALGLLHEHQNPAAGPITWDKPRAYAYYARAMGLSQSAVDYLVFQRYSSNMTQYTAYDPYSIMCFPIPRELAYRKFWAAYNSNLSAVDRTFIGKIYPFG